jgi:hypothetical protein
MRDRAISAVLAIIAVLLALGVLMPNNDQAQTSMPSSQDRGEQGLAVIYHWLEARKFPVKSFRQRWYTLLADYQTGHVLISHAPYRVQNVQSGAWSNASNGYLDAREKRGLLRWVAAGNTVVFAIDALDAAGQTQEARSSSRSDIPLFDVLDGVGFALNGSATESDQITEESIAAASSATIDASVDPAKLRPQALHRLQFRENATSSWQNLESMAWEAQAKHTLALQAVTDYCQSDDFATDLDTNEASAADCPSPLVSKPLAILQSARDESAAGWYLPFGRGGFVVLGYGSVWRNPNINALGSAAFAENLLSQHLKPGGKVLFDDYRYGLSDLYDPQALKRDPRLYKSLALAALLWLIYALARHRRLLPAKLRSKKLSAAGFATRIAELYARHLSPKEQTTAIMDDFYAQAARHLGLDARNPTLIWTRLHAHAHMDATDISALQMASAKAEPEQVNRLCVKLLSRLHAFESPLR